MKRRTSLSTDLTVIRRRVEEMSVFFWDHCANPIYGKPKALETPVILCKGEFSWFSRSGQKTLSFVPWWSEVIAQHSRRIACRHPRLLVSLRQDEEMLMLAPAANQLIGGKKKRKEKKNRWMLSESGRPRENVCLLPGKRERSQSGREKLGAHRARGEEKRGKRKRTGSV